MPKQVADQEKGCIPFYEMKIHPVTGYGIAVQRDPRIGIKKRDKYKKVSED